MNSIPLDFKSVNQYLPHIFLVGIGIGTTNYIIHGQFNWLQWIIQSSSTSFFVGFTLLWIASNKSQFQLYLKKDLKLYFTLAVLFVLIGIIATEIESLIKTLIFLNKAYEPFALDSLYFSNSIISTFLGFSFYLNNRLFSKELPKTENGTGEMPIQKEEPDFEVITKIPIKQGENIQLISVKDIAYFEAFDNYSHLYHSNGKKLFCDYSLIFLEKRLGKDFLRIHRKYIVNTIHIKQIVPHLNGRYLVQFHKSQLNTITSSKGYVNTMRKLVKIE